MGQNKEYYAFISYKREDEKWAKWLQNKLEHYKFPTNLNGRTDLPKNIRPTFRDVTDLSPGLLAEEIDKALRSSEWLIVICSPRSAKSQWVCKEAQTFIDLGRADHIIPFVIEGNPFSKDSSTECYPEALLDLTDGKELLAANINEMGRDAAAIKVVARMFNIRFDTLWQRFEREKKKRFLISIFAVVVFALLCLSVGAYIAQKNVELENLNLALVKANNNTIVERDKAKEQAVIANTERERADKEKENAVLVNNALMIANDSIINQANLINKINKDLQVTTREALENLYVAKTEQVSRLIQSGNIYEAIKICLECLPKSPSDKRPINKDMIRLFREASYKLLSESNICIGELDVNKYHYNDDMDFGITPNERYVWINDRDTLSIYDIETLNLIHRKIPIGSSVYPKNFSSLDDTYISDYSYSLDNINVGKLKLKSPGFNNKTSIIGVEPGISISYITSSGEENRVFESSNSQPIDDKRCIMIWDIESGSLLKSGPLVSGVKNTSYILNGGGIISNPGFAPIGVIDSSSLCRVADIPIYSSFKTVKGHYAIEYDSYSVRMVDLNNPNNNYEYRVPQGKSIDCANSNEDYFVAVIENDWDAEDKLDNPFISIHDPLTFDLIKKYENITDEVNEILISDTGATIYLITKNEDDNTTIISINIDTDELNSFSLPIRYSECKILNNIILFYYEPLKEVYMFDINNQVLVSGKLSDYFMNRKYIILREKEESIASLFILRNDNKNILQTTINKLNEHIYNKNDLFYYICNGVHHEIVDIEQISHNKYIILNENGFYLYHPFDDSQIKLDIENVTKNSFCDIISNKDSNNSAVLSNGYLYIVNNENGDILKKVSTDIDNIDERDLCSVGNLLFIKNNNQDRIYNIDDFDNYLTLNGNISLNPHFSRHGKYIAGYIEDYSLSLFNCTSGELYWNNKNVSSSKGGNLISFSEDDSILSCVSNENIVYNFSVSNGGCITSREFPSEISCIDLGLDSLMLCCCENEKVYLWDIINNVILQEYSIKDLSYAYWDKGCNIVIVSKNSIFRYRYINTFDLINVMNDRFN